MDLDKLNSTKPHHALESAFTVLDAVQSLPQHQRVLGVTLLFHLLCEQLRLDKSEMLNKAERIAHDANSNYFDHIHAVRAYIDNELKD